MMISGMRLLPAASPAADSSPAATGGASGTNLRCVFGALPPSLSPLSSSSLAAVTGTAPSTATLPPASAVEEADGSAAAAAVASARTACQLSEIEGYCVTSDRSKSVSISWATSSFKRFRKVLVGWNSESVKTYGGCSVAASPGPLPADGGKTCERTAKLGMVPVASGSKPWKTGFSRPRIFLHSLLLATKSYKSANRGPSLLPPEAAPEEAPSRRSEPKDWNISKKPHAAVPRT
mmetsp:Transcript_105082/g.263201  ORF Transcript_105082/g.263201 Transcript_105082/m.263201 type:complete len:235 (-) Transcript_105082:3428-4132(-)